MKYTNYNELMRKALAEAKNQGITEQADLQTIITKVFAEDAKEKA